MSTGRLRIVDPVHGAPARRSAWRQVRRERLALISRAGNDQGRPGSRAGPLSAAPVPRRHSRHFVRLL